MTWLAWVGLGGARSIGSRTPGAAAALHTAALQVAEVRTSPARSRRHERIDTVRHNTHAVQAALFLPTLLAGFGHIPAKLLYASQIFPPQSLHRSHAANLSAKLCVLKEGASLPEQRAESVVRFASCCLLQKALKRRLPRLFTGAASSA